MSNCKYETSNGRCGLKGSYAYRHKCYGEDMCRCNEPKTNADHIRAMTDEELAEFLCAATYKENEQGYPIMRTVNKVWWHKWLKQPYEGAAE